MSSEAKSEKNETHAKSFGTTIHAKSFGTTIHAKPFGSTIHAKSLGNEIYAGTGNTSGDLRDKIARALGAGLEDHERPVFAGRQLATTQADAIADAVLAVLGREYAVAREASMPDMSGKQRYTLIVGATFRTREQAEDARKRVPALRILPSVIVSRVAPGTDWEAEQ